MKKWIWALGLTALPTLALAADFNGSWVRDAKSDKDSYPLYWLTRGGAFEYTGGGPVVITVKQDANKVEVADPQRPIRTYELDGKPHTMTMDTMMAKATVTANMQDDKLMVTTSEPYGGMPGNATLTVHEVWSLSPDGKTLTVTTTRDVPAAKQTLKAIYTRK
jgi:hypothetical protein